MSETDALGSAIAAEEHRQGMPVGKLGHCEDCDQKARQDAIAELKRNCPHDETIELTTLGQVQGQLVCAVCGTTTREAL